MEAVFGSFDPFPISDQLRRGETKKALKTLKKRGTLCADEAGACLRSALDCSDAVFRAVLAACPAGEFAESLWLPMEPQPTEPEGAQDMRNPWIAREPGFAAVSLLGTLPVLAAALGETKKLRMLLARGMDCAAASMQACEAVARHRSTSGGFGFGNLQFEREMREGQALGGGSADAVLQIPRQACPEAIEADETMIAAVTPLAAAVFFGQPDCVRLLLDQPGIRAQGSSALEAAALLAAHGTAAQRECVRMVYTLPAQGQEPAEALCAQALLSARTVACFGTPEDLYRRLKSPGATIDEARALLACGALWSESGGTLTARRLHSVFAAFPSLCAEPTARTRLLRVGLKSVSHADCPDAALAGAQSAGDSGAALLRLWREAAGPERDISAGLSVMAKCMQPQELRGVLDFLSEGGQLVAAAEAVLGPWPELELYALLRKVTFYRCCAAGVSALADRILLTQSLRLLRFAVKCGALAGEDHAALLAEAQRLSLPAPARASILTLPPRRTETRSAPDETQWQYYSGAGEAERQALGEAIVDMFTSPVPAETCRALLERRERDGSVRLCQLDFERIEPNGYLRPKDLYAAVLCGANPAARTLAPALLDPVTQCVFHDPREILHGAVRADVTDLANGELSCTPLCLAAAAGNCAAVERYLAEGADPDENDCAGRSALCFGENAWRRRLILVTPLAMALWYEQEDTALLLLRAGADRPLAEHIVRRIIVDDDPEKLAEMEAEEVDPEWADA